MGVDLDDRDPEDINFHIRALYEDVFAEPEGTRSTDCAWFLSTEFYTFYKDCLYKFLSLFCGCWFAIYWGTQFAFETFRHVWCITPLARTCSITFGAWQRFWGVCLFCFIAPIADSCGAFLSKIRMATRTNRRR